jgi:TM2 domain-containing membrane protein YozV
MAMEYAPSSGNSAEMRATMAHSEFQAAQKNAAAAYLLCIFLGAFGAHRFYLGRNGSGLAMLLITVLSLGIGLIVTAVWALVDLFLIGGILRQVNDKILAGIWQRYGLSRGGYPGAPGQVFPALPQPGPPPAPGQATYPGQP